MLCKTAVFSVGRKVPPVVCSKYVSYICCCHNIIATVSVRLWFLIVWIFFSSFVSLSDRYPLHSILGFHFHLLVRISLFCITQHSYCYFSFSSSPFCFTSLIHRWRRSFLRMRRTPWFISLREAPFLSFQYFLVSHFSIHFVLSSQTHFETLQILFLFTVQVSDPYNIMLHIKYIYIFLRSLGETPCR